MNEIPTTFVEPEKLIIPNKELFGKFKFSKTFFMLTNLIDMLGNLVRGKPNYSVGKSPFILLLDQAMDEIFETFNSTPLESRNGKYGNPAFREFVDRLTRQIESIHKPLLNKEIGALIEVEAYFLDAFGSYGRLDYGTGHELNFFLWFVCFLRLGIAGTKEDLEGFALCIFPRYIELCLKIQNIYTLEPAGSRGAWSVDDYNLLPFVFGASELCHNKECVENAFSESLEKDVVKVKDIFDKEIMDKYKNEYMYCRMLSNIYEVKSFSLETNSPFISQVHLVEGQSWDKVYEGMRRHYTHEVFEKWPVIQHFWFGNIFKLE